LYEDALRRLPKGVKYATDYHNLMTAILIKLFIPPLKTYKIESEINEGRKRIDLVFTNNPETGFFGRLITQHNIHAPYIIIECKNYNIEIHNEQLDQLIGRFSDTRGKFGILTYREAEDEDELLKRCKDALGDSKYIITLNDEDIMTMLNYRLAGDEVDQLMEEKMQRLIF
jgi:hypothetical protein